MGRAAIRPLFLQGWPPNGVPAALDTLPPQGESSQMLSATPTGKMSVADDEERDMNQTQQGA